MRISRFLVPFILGAVCMLAAVIAADRAAPALMDRVRTTIRPAARGPARAMASRPPTPADSPAVVAQGAIAPMDSASEQPFVVVPPGDLPTTQEGASAAPVATVVPPAAPEPAAGQQAARLLIPVQGVKAGSLVDTYDQARSQGRRHDAIDIMAPRGTPVLATADGVVMKLFQSVRGGTALYELAPDRRTIYYYAHLDRYAPGVAEGHPLRRGEVLGYVGNTGDAGPGNYHLHFEVSTTPDPKKYWGGVAQNPYPLLR